jgi:hypothetical protein
MRIPLMLTLALACALPLVGGGCNPTTAVNKDAETTFLNDHDMTQMTDQMAASIIADPYLAQQSMKAPLKIVIKPVINETSEIIRDNRAEIFVHRLQGLLASNRQLSGRFIWLMNRDDHDKLVREEVPGAANAPNENAIQPEYALYAKFLTDTNATTKTRSDTYLCQYYITRIAGENNREILWTGQYITSKKIKKEFLD